MDLTRRRALAAGAAAGVFAAFPVAAMARAGRLPQLFIFDARFAPSRDAARHMASLGVATLDPRVRDLGVAWREDIAPMVAQGNNSLAGMTLWSDRLICETFAREHGLSLEELSGGQGQAELPHGLSHWALA